MAAKSIFADEWRDCLRAHYTYVVRNNDKLTERTLRGVMFEAGFTEAELTELTVRATMRAEDMDADFVPDLEILEAASVVVPGIAVAVPQEVIEAELVEESLALGEVTIMAEFDATEADAEIDMAEAAVEESEANDSEMDETQEDEPPVDPDITQLSLF